MSSHTEYKLQIMFQTLDTDPLLQIICKNYTDSFKIEDKFKLFVSNFTIFKVPLKSL